MRKNVVILDGNHRSALAATRSLGKRGINVIVGAESVPSLASSSKYCCQSFLYPSPAQAPDAFIKALKAVIIKIPRAIIYPMTDVTLSEVLMRKSELGSEVKIPFPEYDTYTAVSDKSKLFQVAFSMNLPAPKTLFPDDFKDEMRLMAEAYQLGFPLVIKPAFSRIRTETGWINTSVRYIRDENELKAVLHEESLRSHPYLIQERIEGSGIGIFLLMDKGKFLAWFAHKRKREKPPSGGVSVLCESIEPPPTAMDSAVRLLQHFNWSGVAMVEFKLDRRDNLPKLMEVNARFWGSLELAISSGVDFPYLLYCLATGDTAEVPGRYKIGVRSRWELGDLDHLLIRLKKTKKQLFMPSDAPSIIMTIMNFLADSFSPSVRNEVMKIHDLRPFLFELKQYVRHIIA